MNKATVSRSVALAVLILLFLSLAFNVYHCLHTYHFARGVQMKELPGPSSSGSPVWPIEGLSRDDVQGIVADILRYKGTVRDRRILLIRVKDYKRVEVHTGTLTGPHAGGGDIFIFERKQRGWELDETSIGSWVS
jgi:hypothetical protein